MTALLVAILFSQPISAQDAPQKMASVEGVTEYKLSNGARVLLYPENSRPNITINMTVLVGSRHEGYGETGMAHLLEHMVFKGTPTFRNVPKAIQDHGANFNGTTNEDRTNYFETMPASDENLEFGIQLESDRLVNSFVRREDLISEMTVVRNEFERGENNPGGILNQKIHAAAYEWHNYGKSTIGNRSDIERVPIENLQAFYKKFYQPDNVVLIITGKFEEANALALVQKYLGSIPKPKRVLSDTYTEEPAQDGERSVTLRRVGTVGSVGIAYHMPAASHADWAPLNLLGNIISQQPNGRLYKALVESKKSSGVFANASNMHDPGLFMVAAQAEPAKLDDVRDTLIQVMENLGKEAFTSDEVERAKVRVKRGDERRFTDAVAMSQSLSSASALGDWRLLFIQRDRLAAVTAEDVNRVAKAYFQRQNRTVGVYIPQDKPNRISVPASPNLKDVVKDYKGGAVTEAGEVFDPTPENLDTRTKIVELDGLKVGMLAKKNRGESVSLVLTLHYGNEESLRPFVGAAGMLPNMMMAGTKKHDRESLREELDRLGIRISAGMGGGGGRRPGGGRGGAGPGGTPGQLTFSVEAKKSTLPQAITLLGEILREPSFPDEEFDTMKRRGILMQQNNRTDPAALAGNKLQRAMSPYPPDDIRYVPTMDEAIKRLEDTTLDQIQTLYKTQIGAGHGELGIVGDFDPEKTLTQIKEILKDWKSEVPVRRIERTAPKNMMANHEDIVTPDKANAVFMAGLAFPMKEGDPDYAAMRIGNYMFGGGTLSSRLGNRIRQKEGLSYGVTSSLNANPRDNAASFTINAITNPANIQKVEKAVEEELTEFLKNGPSQSELSDAQRAYLESQKASRTSDAGIASQITTNLQLGRSFSHISEMEKKINNLSPDEVRAAFLRHIDPKKIVIIRAGDFKDQK
ncbi:insulinase family protein [Telmatocola sphagniphila]|uniref:Insulinase family protein n=2 Tax=Telmatocola sphagniphila TaxID=1123043 RepID=A0A8E6BBN0_9BACT|nr:insulinase family protein [Telmatocola sphagniphila]